MFLCSTGGSRKHWQKLLLSSQFPCKAVEPSVAPLCGAACTRAHGATAGSQPAFSHRCAPCGHSRASRSCPVMGTCALEWWMVQPGYRLDPSSVCLEGRGETAVLHWVPSGCCGGVWSFVRKQGIDTDPLSDLGPPGLASPTDVMCQQSWSPSHSAVKTATIGLHGKLGAF